MVKMLRCRRGAAAVSQGPKLYFVQLFGRSRMARAPLDEEHTQIAVSALRDAAKDRAITGRHLFWHEAKPGGNVSPFREASSIADRSHRGACNDRADARNTHQLPTVHVVRAGPSISSVTISMRSSRHLQSSTPSPMILSIRGDSTSCAWLESVAAVAAESEVLASRQCRAPEQNHGPD